MRLRKVKITGGNNKGKQGLFHGFFQCGDETGTEPVAIVELEDGRVVDVSAVFVTFLNEEQK